MNHCNNGGYLQTYNNNNSRHIALLYQLKLRGVFKFQNSIANLASAFKSESQELPHFFSFTLYIILLVGTAIFDDAFWLQFQLWKHSAQCLLVKNQAFDTLLFRVLELYLLSTQWKNGLVKASRRGLFFIFMSNCLNN